MKNLILILVGMLILTLPAFSELSDSDIERIKEIVKVEGQIQSNVYVQK
ncbi:MAG: hypothetical protein OXU23_14635 [Candidatus Poribacteria bacterium]|nr:hypothetical protein [Candidatus Poribacteria bacterium]